jgi:hypothetical protein
MRATTIQEEIMATTHCEWLLRHTLFTPKRVRR